MVLAYHGDLPWTRGGFLALSQFFTLSGFLITGVLLRSHFVPGGSLASFWRRRAHRLLPAAFAALAIVVVFGATVATRQQADALPGQVAAAATWTVNWQFIVTGQSYVHLFAAPSPVQHFWSLSVEEQFYILLPIAMLVLLRKSRSPRALAAMFGAGALLSTAWMIFLYEHGASLDRLYYGTDTRMAEFLTGAVVAVIFWHRGFNFSERARRALAVAGVAALAISLWCCAHVSITDPVLWRGGYLAFSLVTCVLITSVLCGRGPVAWLLSWGVLAAIGRITYGLYLYHWPIFLWLTPQRTGLSTYPLFGLRVAVTFAVAIVSYRYLELPFLRGRSVGIRGPARYALVPLVAIALIVATLVTVNRNAYDPLATLSGASASQPAPAGAGNTTLRILVIAQHTNDPVVQRMVKLGASGQSYRVTVAPAFECTGGLVTTSHGRTCASWADAWPELIRRDDPDAVLLYLDSWAGNSLASLSGPSRPEQADFAASVLGPALDLLAANHAALMWASPSVSFKDAVRRSLQPFNQAMSRLVAKRSDLTQDVGTRLPDPTKVTHEQYVALSASVLLSDVALNRRPSRSDLPRVMIVGDSQAASLGYGLQQWAQASHRAIVWNRGIDGCGVVVDGDVRQFGGFNTGGASCRGAVAAWPSQVAFFKPQVVIVLSSLNDVQDRRLPGTSRFVSVGDPNFDLFVLHAYEHDVDVLSAGGSRVVWMTAPCIGLQPQFGQANPYSSAGIDKLDSTILPRLAQARPDKVRLFDLARVICPAGKSLDSVPGGAQTRPDGVHFSADAARWFADAYGAKVLAVGGVR